MAQTPAVIRSKYGDRNQFLQRVNPSTQMAFARRPEMAISGDYPSLAELNAAYGKDMDVAWLALEVNDIAAFTGARGLAEGQQEQLARMIAVEQPAMKVTELMLFFHRFKAGKYGRFYGNVDPMVVMTALQEFLRERNELLVRTADQRAEQWRQWAEEQWIDLQPQIATIAGVQPTAVYLYEVNGYRRLVRIGCLDLDIFDALVPHADKIANLSRQVWTDATYIALRINVAGGHGHVLYDENNSNNKQ